VIDTEAGPATLLELRDRNATQEWLHRSPEVWQGEKAMSTVAPRLSGRCLCRQRELVDRPRVLTAIERR
jgi:hypothetical protein